jgi:hypothetical protein
MDSLVPETRTRPRTPLVAANPFEPRVGLGASVSEAGVQAALAAGEVGFSTRSRRGRRLRPPALAWKRLGLDYLLASVDAPSPAAVERVCAVFRAAGLAAF